MWALVGPKEELSAAEAFRNLPPVLKKMTGGLSRIPRWGGRAVARPGMQHLRTKLRVCLTDFDSSSVPS